MTMASNRKIWTWFEGEWHEGNVPILGSADHGTWLGTMVFDGARFFEGVAPDLDLHCERVVNSCHALGMKPVMQTGEILELAREGCTKFDGGTAVYVRPMMWSTEAGDMTVKILELTLIESGGMAMAVAYVRDHQDTIGYGGQTRRAE